VSAIAPSPLDLDVLRATLGPAVVAPYEHAFGAVPWLTAGTLTWPADHANDVLWAWCAWTAGLPASALTAVRLGGSVVAVDVALIGDPWAAPQRLAPLRRLAPGADTVGIASPGTLTGRRGGAPAQVAVDSRRLLRRPDVDSLIDAAVPGPEGVALGLRHDGSAGDALIGLGIASDTARIRAAVERVARALALSAATT
jgi:hypothetical protein